MINAIIFDFGDVFINLDTQTTINDFKNLGLSQWNEDLDRLNLQYELGSISEKEFLSGIQKHTANASLEDISKAWNAMLLDFPLYRLEFLQILSQKYRLFLLSNTDATHIRNFEQKSGATFYSVFYQCFEKVYFSFEIGMRKPNPETYIHILDRNGLQPKHTLFIDDKKENTDAASALGIQVWNLQVGKEDIIDLFDKKIIY